MDSSMSNFDLKNMTYDQLKGEAARLETELARIRPIIEAYDKAQEATKDRNTSIVSREPKQTLFEDSFAGMTTHDALVSLLNENDKPLTTKQILTAFEARGKMTEAKEPMVSLYNGLDGASKRQETKIIKLGGGYWGLKGRDENCPFI